MNDLELGFETEAKLFISELADNLEEWSKNSVGTRIGGKIMCLIAEIDDEYRLITIKLTDKQISVKLKIYDIETEALKREYNEWLATDEPFSDWVFNKVLEVAKTKFK